jgi:NAD(P)H dehydrogenase (quinone)
MSIVITGASGHLGREVAEQLIERVPPSEVILATRRPRSLADLAERGADVRHADFDEPGTLGPAFGGGSRMLLVSTDQMGRRVDQHRAAIDAAAAAGVRHVVYTSLTNPVAGHPTGIVADENRETEEMLERSGLAWTVLRNAAYAELQVPLGALAVTFGKLVTNAGDGRIAPISRRDCAAAAVSVLTTDGHEGRTYEITGPEALSQADIAALFAEVSGRPVQVVEMADRKMVRGLMRIGTPKAVARAISDLGIATREGYFDLVDGAFEALTGRRPATLRDVLIANRGELLRAA